MNREEKLAIVRRTASDGMVLLKNENSTLPISKDKKIALFGIASYRCFELGWGSGDMLSQLPVEIYEGFENSGYKIDQKIKEIALKWVNSHSEEYKDLNRNWGKWAYRFNEFDIGDTIIEESSQNNDIAIVTIGRCCGESEDLKDEEGFFRLHSEEVSLIKRVSEKFAHTVLLLNVCGVIDIRSIDGMNIDSIVDVSLGGEQMGNSVADIVSGKVNPSAKLAATWAYKYDDYPTRDGITTKVVPYNEGIYVGYRYFDTFGVEPRYPFGYGLSYTTFDIEAYDFTLDGPFVEFGVRVKNTGRFTGKEILQCYLSSPDGKLEKPYQELCAFIKTDDIKPGETEETSIVFDISTMASYCEKTAQFVLEKGRYFVRLGDSSRNTRVIFAIDIDKDIVCEKVTNRLAPKNDSDLKLISKNGATPYSYSEENDEKASAPVLKLDCDSIETIMSDSKFENVEIRALQTKNTEKIITLEDVANGDAEVEDVVAQFSDEELAILLNGLIYEGADANANVGSMSSKVRGAAGEIWNNEKYGIPANACADGPAGIRLGMFNKPMSDDQDMARLMVAYPSGTCLANTWDRDNAYNFGICVKSDMEIAGIEGWLAPGMNIQRNPLNGRNFEYFSEDPIISGNMASYITFGVQYDEDGAPTGRYITIKHFACNNIEYERGLSDSRASERALREIYLKGFRIAVEQSAPLAVMTAYNRINGEFSSANYDLLNGILRGEWGFDGLVMTDWNPSADPKMHSFAGNDLIMPGCHRKEVLEGLKDGTVNRAVAQLCATRILTLIMRTNFVIRENNKH